MTQTCPTAKVLRSLVDGSLSDIEAQPLEMHIDRCEVCQRTLQELAADGTLWKTVATSLSDDKIVGPGLDRVIETLQHQSRDDAEEIGEAIELKLSFIEPATEPGTIGRLRHYDILRVAGRGGMGIVLKAFDRSLRRVVAIKLLAPHLAGNGQARQRFVREGRAAAAICHEHVVTIHAVEESPPFLVMQYVHGETLEARIHRNGSLDVRDAVRIALQIAQGLAAAHSQGVVHRDIKPANILLENGVARVRITDFGLARAVDDASLTQSGVVAGTPQYMAPEQANGDAIDERADLFSLGSVLYTMLAGHAPFRATTAMGVLKRLCDNAPRPVREINPETPDWLVVLINRLHAKRPADRFHNASEVAALLERGLAAMQTGTQMPVPFAASETSAVAATATAETMSPSADSSQESRQRDSHTKGIDTTVLVQRPGTTEASSEGWERGSGAVGQRQPSPVIGDVRAIFRRLLPPYPLWLLFAVVGLLVAPFVPMAGLMGAVIALIAFAAPRFMPRVTAKLLNDSASANAATGTGLQAAAGSTPQPSVSSMGLLSMLGWLMVWILPAVFWTSVFFYEEREALSGSSYRLRLANQLILPAMVAIFVAWLVTSVFWFRRRHRNRSFVFRSGVRRRGILTVAGLAAIFCACGYGTWESDVYRLAQQRISSNNPRYPQTPIGVEIQRFPLEIDFEGAWDGVRVIIDSENGPVEYAQGSDATLASNFSGRSGTYPWHARLGQTKIASGEVTFERGKFAVIRIARPNLLDLIAGRWRTESHSASFGSGGAEQSQTNADEFEFHHDAAIIALREDGLLTRSDLRLQIDESVTPALITFTASDGQKLAGIVRFEPGAFNSSFEFSGMSGMTMDAGSGMASMGSPNSLSDMMGGGASPDNTSRKDRLLICVSEGASLRPWQFQHDPDHGITLFELVRSQEADSLQDSLALEPLPIGTTADVVKQAVLAWSKRLNIPVERCNSIGIDLTLVPPARFDLPPTSALRDQRILLPETQKIVNENSAREARPIVSYPFVISRDVISIGQFRQFVDETGYITDAERGEPLRKADSPIENPLPVDTAESATPVDDAAGINTSSAKSIGGWHRKDGKFVWQDGLTWKTSEPDTAIAESDPESATQLDDSTPVTVLSLRDTNAFCEWLSTKENRQYRLPTSAEWTAAIQLGAVRLPPAVDRKEYLEYRAWLDASVPNPLGIKTSKQVFGEWTADSIWTFNEIVHKDVSDDGQRFDLSHKYVAPLPFRSSEISFRVVAELQTLTPQDQIVPSDEDQTLQRQ